MCAGRADAVPAGVERAAAGATHIGGMDEKSSARADAAASLLTTLKTELASLPEGPWERYGATIEGACGKPVMDTEVDCGSYCLGGTPRADLIPEAESFLVNSGTRSRLMLTALESVLGLHRAVPVRDEDGEPDGTLCCEECTDLDEGSGERVHQSWPCRTVTEIQLALNSEMTRTQLRTQIEADVAARTESI